MHVFDPQKSGDIMGVDEAQRFWNHAENIVGLWKSTKPGPSTAHMAEVLLQISENMVEADQTRDTGAADFKRCNHGIPAHRHVWLVGRKWCPAMKKDCNMGADNELVPAQE